MKKPILIAVLAVLLLSLSTTAAFASGGNYHKVKYGENLYRIGLYYGVSYHAIAKANNLYNANHIYAGQVLYIPKQDNYNKHYNDYNSNYHIIRRGETLSSISYSYGVSAWAIAKHNNIYNLNRIYAGQKLYIPMGY